MRLKQHVAWWAGVVATLVGVVGGFFGGAALSATVSGVGWDQELSGTATLFLCAWMFGGGISGYLVVFALWILTSRLFLSREELLEVARNTVYQSRGATKRPSIISISLGS